MKDEQVYLRHIPDAARQIDAVIRNLEIIGEAVKALPPELRLQHAEARQARLLQKSPADCAATVVPIRACERYVWIPSAGSSAGRQVPGVLPRG